MKRYFQIAIVFLCSLPGMRAQVCTQAIDSLQQELGLTILYDQKVTGSWPEIRYDHCQDSTDLLNYVRLLHREYLKYPKDYFSKTGVKTIVLAKKLFYGTQNRAAIPDPYLNTLYLAIDGSYGNVTQAYLLYVMHHELHHCTEYAIWNSMYYRWKDWSKINPWYFRYGKGGSSAYDQLDTDWTRLHPKKGFVDLYATTGQEEDRSELMAMIMVDNDRKNLLMMMKKDKRIRKKVVLITQLLNGFTGITDAYWQQVLQ